jgi:hypothetical protein
VAWFVRQVAAGAPEGGLTISIECWLSLLDQERCLDEGKERGTEALRTALSLAGIAEEWYRPLIQVLGYDADLLGWEDRVGGLPMDHLIHNGRDWDNEEEYLDARRRWAWVRTALWDFGSLSLGGAHGYPAWVSLGTHRDGGYYKHKGRFAPPPPDERGPDLVYVREGGAEKLVNEAAVRLMYARNRGKVEGYTRQLRWLEENRCRWALGMEDTVWLWSLWEDIFREGLRVLGRPVDVRARAHLVGIEEPSKRYLREVRGRREVAVDCMGLGGSRGGFGEVLFTEASGAGEKSWLTVREVRERWALEVAVLEAQSRHPAGTGRPSAELLFQGREGWGLRAFFEVAERERVASGAVVPSCGMDTEGGSFQGGPPAPAGEDAVPCAPAAAPQALIGEDAGARGSDEDLQAPAGQDGASGPRVLEDVEMGDAGGEELRPVVGLTQPTEPMDVEGAEPGQGIAPSFDGEPGAGLGQGQEDEEGEWIEVRRKGRKVREGGKAQSQ